MSASDSNGDEAAARPAHGLRSSLLGAGQAALQETRRAAAFAAALAQIEKLKRVDLFAAHQALGRRVHTLGVLRDVFPDEIADLDQLQRQIEERSAGAEASANGLVEKLRRSAHDAVAKASAEALKLKLGQRWAALGARIGTQAPEELRAEREAVTAVLQRIAEAEGKRAAAAGERTELNAHLRHALDDGRVELKQAWQHGGAQLGELAQRSGGWWQKFRQSARGRKTIRFALFASALFVAGSLFLHLREEWRLARVADEPEGIAYRADKLAAHPDDPTRPRNVRGVSDQQLVKGERTDAAVQACVRALQVFPDETRFEFQLGRALLLGGFAEEASPFLRAAAQKGHGGALAYLARTEGDVARATELFQQAAAAGFQPAKKMNEELQEHAAVESEKQVRLADELAAHPGDGTKPRRIKGVPDTALASPEALEKAADACALAVQSRPWEARQQFQFGRVLFLAGLSEEARPHLESAAAKGHAGALAYLGQMEGDLQKAASYLDRAVAGGFEPAVAMRAALPPDFQKQGYLYGDVFQALHAGDNDFLNSSRWKNLHLAMWINSGLKSSGPRWHRPELNLKAQVEIQRTTNAPPPSSGEQLFKAFITGNLGESYYNEPLEPDAREAIFRDMARLTAEHGKNEAVLRQLSEGLHQFVR